MIFNPTNWPHKYFGVFIEYGEVYRNYPSVKDFVDAPENASYDKKRLREYLDNGFALIATSRSAFPSPFDGEICYESIAFKTDGTWIWLDNISDFIDNNDLALPISFHNHILQNNYTIPELNDEDVERLHIALQKI